ncbi:vWA domain-containing protein [Baaleninema sp.]|uniref:vWA domain-containing protein n=1 Tax=Baaleninema sp. TaxID=3101197 RepID=UPI003CFD2734
MDRDSIERNLKNLTQKLRKPLLFGLFGGTGCLAAAGILGETWLYLTRRPPTTVTEPQAVVLLIDSSSSMSEGKLPEVQEAAAEFVNRQDLDLHDLAVVAFSNNPRLLANLDAEAAELHQAISSLYPSGNTNLYEALNAAASVLRDAERETPATPHILLFTDGQPNNPYGAESVARQLRNADINLVAVGTGDAQIDYLAMLTGDRNRVFFANSGEIDKAFQAAESVIYGKQLVESDDSGDYGLVFGVVRIGVWTGFLALGTSLFLIVGQNYTLRRRWLSASEAALGGGGGFLAGLTGGAVGQLAFVPVANVPALSWLARVTGWTLLGTLVGGGMSFFVPNLPLSKALLAGALGGVLGAAGFLLLEAISGAIAARLAGAAILGFCIGLAIALSEQFDRKAVLYVRWTDSEFTTISLGKEPIEIGSSRNAHVYLPKDAGFPAKFARMFVENGKVMLEFDSSIQKLPKFKNMKLLRQEVEDGSRRKFGQVLLEVKQKNIVKSLPSKSP